MTQRFPQPDMRTPVHALAPAASAFELAPPVAPDIQLVPEPVDAAGQHAPGHVEQLALCASPYLPARHTPPMMPRTSGPRGIRPRESSTVRLGDMDFDKVLQLLRELHRHEVEYILVGDVALNLLGLVRPTDSVDLLIRPTEENVERLRRALRAVWDDPEIDKIAAAELAGDFSVVRYGPPTDDVIVDIIARPGEAFRFDDVEYQVQTYEGISVRIATPRMLYRMKRGTSRLADRGDAERLNEKFKFEDE